jgi:hypothetical protein
VLRDGPDASRRGSMGRVGTAYDCEDVGYRQVA